MKKYFFFAAALAALASCSKVEPEDQNGPEISFQAARYTIATKAEGDDKDGAHKVFYSDGSFGVYSYFTTGTSLGDANPLSGGTVYMDNAAVSKNTDNAYAPTRPYYWPKAGRLSFIGYYPYGDTAPFTVTRSETTMTLATSAAYTVVEALAGQKTNFTSGKSLATADLNDLMYATPVYNINGNPDAVHYDNDDDPSTTYKGVPMLFHHTLSKVYFKVKLATLEDREYALPLTTTLTGINVLKIANTGTCAIDPAAATPVVWTRTAPTSASTYNSGDFVADDTVINKASGAGQAAEVSFTSDQLYVLPQELVDEVCSVKVSYTVSAGEGKDSQNYSPVINLRTDAITTWEPNKIYCYTITIDPFSGEIYFDPAVVDWSSPEAEVNKEIKEDTPVA